MKAHTEIVLASELSDRVIQRIFETRNPDAMPNYRKELAKYKKRIGKREEKEAFRRVDADGSFESFEKVVGSRKVVGFEAEHMGEKVFVERPKEPSWLAWLHRPYSDGMRAQEYGLLADSAFNRQIRVDRVEQYKASMAAGEWYDLFSDPITLTDDGHVVNGQHRLAAASLVDWTKVENDPAFLVVWGVDPFEAYHADRGRRTAKDETTIAHKLGNAIRAVARD